MADMSDKQRRQTLAKLQLSGMGEYGHVWPGLLLRVMLQAFYSPKSLYVALQKDWSIRSKCKKHPSMLHCRRTGLLGPSAKSIPLCCIVEGLVHYVQVQKASLYVALQKDWSIRSKCKKHPSMLHCRRTGLLGPSAKSFMHRHINLFKEQTIW